MHLLRNEAFTLAEISRPLHLGIMMDHDAGAAELPGRAPARGRQPTLNVTVSPQR